MITRFKRSYQKGYYKFLNEFHHNQELENTTKQQKKNTQTFINQLRKLINDINYCIVKNLKKIVIQLLTISLKFLKIRQIF